MSFRLLVALTLFLTACGHEHEPPPQILSFDVKPLEVKPGDALHMTVKTAHFTLVPDDDSDSADSVLVHAEGANGSSPNSGHFHVYLDDRETNPLLMPATESFDCTLPTTVTPGQHTLIVRLHSQDHLIIRPEVSSEFALTVDQL
jgi:hypothetical protein